MNELFKVKKLDYYVSQNVYSMRETPLRTVKFYEIELYTTSGNISVINGEKYRQSAGNILISQPGDLRCSIDMFECYCVHFLCSDAEIIKTLNSLPKVFGAYNAERFVQIFKNMLNAHAAKSTAQRFMVQGGIAELLGCILNEAEEEHGGKYERFVPAVSAACTFMQNNIENRITLNDISKRVCLSPSFFHSVFKSIKGITPAEYLVRQRITAAKEMLRLNNLSLSEIAVLCGFGSQGYFNYVFKKQTGITPKKYRDKKQIII